MPACSPTNSVKALKAFTIIIIIIIIITVSCKCLICSHHSTATVRVHPVLYVPAIKQPKHRLPTTSISDYLSRKLILYWMDIIGWVTGWAAGPLTAAATVAVTLSAVRWLANVVVRESRLVINSLRVQLLTIHCRVSTWMGDHLWVAKPLSM